jgi:hypothetical protein
MPKRPFESLTLDDLKAKLLKVSPVLDASTGFDAEANRLYYLGDHWQTGRAWAGPSVDKADNDSAVVLAKIQTQFTSANKIAEVVDRHVDGVLGREVSWMLESAGAAAQDTPAEEEPEEDGDQPPAEKPEPKKDPLVSEAEELLTAWWDKRGMTQLMKDACAQVLHSQKANLRLYIPNGLLEDDGTLPVVSDLSEAMDLLYVDVPALESAGMVEDKSTKQRAGIYTWKDEEDNGTDWVEITYLVDDPADMKKKLTVLRVFQADSKDGPATIMLDLAGNLLMHEIKVPRPMVTAQMRSLQAQYNKSLTMMGHNSDMAGFLERTILNGELPGTWELDKTAPGGKRFKPDPVRMGARTVNFIKGIEVDAGNEGGKTVVTPSIVYRDPVPVTTFVDTFTAYYAAILEEAKQTHVLLSKDAGASGESRLQARQDFLKSLNDTKPLLDEAVRWLLTTVLELACHVGKQVGRFRSLRPVSQIKPDAGPLTLEERKQISDDYKAGLRSRESTMALLGVDDVDAEIKRIDAEWENRPLTTEDCQKVGALVTADPKAVAETLKRAGIPAPDAAVLQADKDREVEMRQQEVEARSRMTDPVADE